MKGFNKSGLAAFFSLILSPSAFAFYCSVNGHNGFINIGDSTDQVKQACGDPDTAQDAPLEGEDKITTIQYWLYQNVQVNYMSPLAVEGPFTNVTRNGPPMVFEITNSLVTAITQGGNSVTATTACPEGAVRIGTSIDRLIEACGQPTTVNMQNQQTDPVDRPKVLTWTYSDPYDQQPIVLQFIDGRLSSINAGPQDGY